MRKLRYVAFAGAIVLSYLAGYVSNHSGAIQARQAPAGTPRHAQIAMAPDRGEVYHWSGDDMTRAHKATIPNPRFNMGEMLQRPITRTHMFNFRHSAPAGAGAEAPDGEEHTGVSELHIVIGGSGTAYMGGTLESRRSSPERPGEFNGHVKGGRNFKVKAGDIVNIPPGTPHAYQPDAPEGITYMLVKINVGLYPWSMVAGSN